MTGFEARTLGNLLLFLLTLAVLGIPFFLWQQGNVWGPITGVLSGLVIYPITLVVAWMGITGDDPRNPPNSSR